MPEFRQVLDGERCCAPLLHDVQSPWLIWAGIPDTKSALSANTDLAPSNQPIRSIAGDCSSAHALAKVAAACLFAVRTPNHTPQKSMKTPNHTIAGLAW